MGKHTFKIEQGVPLPAARSTGVSAALRALAASGPGSSVLLSRSSSRALASHCKSVFGKTMKEVGFTMRKVEGGVRVWKL